MNSEVLWRRLSPTDFRAMNGEASPFGRGGGATHIALGVSTDRLPINNFLNAGEQTETTVFAAADSEETQGGLLSFSGNPARRGGEWRIRDQYSNRHPAWATAAGFPRTYDHNNPPYVLVFKIGESFHARFCLKSDLLKINLSDRPKEILSIPTGIASVKPEFIISFDVSGLSPLEEFSIQQDKNLSETFDPKNLSDGRKRIISAVVRRLGQQSFRRKLISAYTGKCAMTQCNTIYVLEAAHITPYIGIKTNAVSNGLLLRADIHTLFDLALISIEPSKVVVRVSNFLKRSQYEELDGKQPTLPSELEHRPSTAALDYHYRLFLRDMRPEIANINHGRGAADAGD